MTNDSLSQPAIITSSTKAAFLQYLHENPNLRRVSRTEKETLIEWLIDPCTKPSSQKESSRRNYIRKTFTWNEETRTVLAVAKKDKERDREVVTEDTIADVIECVHVANGHAGWDATWKAISSSYYGILRADVIFLLKRCRVCAQNPRKCPKGLQNTTLPACSLHHEHIAPDFLDIEDILFDQPSSNEAVNSRNASA